MLESYNLEAATGSPRAIHAIKMSEIDGSIKIGRGSA